MKGMLTVLESFYFILHPSSFILAFPSLLISFPAIYSGGSSQRRLIRLATKPAPNPLSIFTTVTFDAHELSIPSSAAKPSNDAPYPILVGTAITGTDTIPPTTDGSAPSIPATTTITRAVSNSARAPQKSEEL